MHYEVKYEKIFSSKLHSLPKTHKKLFGKYKPDFIAVPWEIYANFDYHYLGYDKDGVVKKGFKNIVDALKNRGNLGLTVQYDKY
jgi:mRNA-degrading endonuclease RelE of RelBE toxin-antitoxin system